MLELLKKKLGENMQILVTTMKLRKNRAEKAY